jgi:lipopolysaccharide transport system ATP-binding protein
MEAGRARMKPVLVFENVTKEFRTYHRYHAGLKALVLDPRQIMRHRERDTFLAINQVSFAVEQGETFGILGRNGAGKSTLLALIAGVLRPTSGKISVRGHISPLLELGIGFTFELTGVENILINGVLLGLRKKEIEAKLDDIIEFSGLSSFIDQPIKTYSSGMMTRLGFAIAIHAQPDILLVDEVLAVGDAEFQEKCFARIMELQKAGVTIVLVSHNLNTVETICDRALWIDKGRIVTLGSPQEVVARYQSEIDHLLATPDSTSASASV